MTPELEAQDEKEITPVRKAHAETMVMKTKAMNDACYRLSGLEQEILAYAISLARDNQVGLQKPNNAYSEPLYIRAADFAEFWQYKGGSIYTELKKAVNSLFEREFRWSEKTLKLNKTWKVRGRWVSEAGYMDGEGMIRITLSHTVVEQITCLEAPYIKYRLSGLVRVRSAHAIRLFDLLMSWQGTGWMWISLDDVKEKFGVADKNYTVTELKRRVLTKGKDVINERSPQWTVAYKDVTKGRKIVGFKFLITLKPEWAEAQRQRELEEFLAAQSVSKPSGAPFSLEWLEKHVTRGQGESLSDYQQRGWHIWGVLENGLDPKQLDAFPDDGAAMQALRRNEEIADIKAREAAAGKASRSAEQEKEVIALVRQLATGIKNY